VPIAKSDKFLEKKAHMHNPHGGKKKTGNGRAQEGAPADWNACRPEKKGGLEMPPAKKVTGERRIPQ